ncbi:hypothetical protein JRQ81_012674 [Phrynocephalus forsythii]|uniref:Cadherin domain-containing protein n=1 Tax=Phrynocephalus forsythii TaxID=171643 RepID=A0A9Q0Y2M5_9SAUR|nr:hypothetical protein JRQ81_012674 [Phrynocephalus forsythii]
MVLPAAGRYRTSILGKTIWLPPLVSLLVSRKTRWNWLQCNSKLMETLAKITNFTNPVNINKCSNHSGIISSSNPNFTVLKDGSLYTTNAIFLSSRGNTITLSFKDIHEKETKKIHVNLLTNPKKAQSVMARRVRETVLSRSKRRWAPVPTIIMENSLGPFPMQIQQLSSDMALKYSIRYSISGPGVDKPPLNYFYIEADTGNLFVTRPIDREQYPEFQLICYAMTSDGYTPEIPLVHTIKIEDDNDNAPVFDHDIYTFYILEHSKLGTIVGQVTATDKDEPNTLHTKLKYKIVNRNLQIYQNSHIFVINPDTGCITVASSHLDRETAAEYKLEIEARDMGGQDFGLCSTAIVLIEVGDVNDNAPQLGQTTYEVSVAENTENLEILCIPVIDDDEPGTPSWLATFTIIKGNEDNSFYITVDQNTNVGCLILSKELDYENTKERRLEIVVNNEATYVFPPNTRAVSTSLITVVIRVRDQDEGPVFEPCEYILTIKECLPSRTVVGNYQARDPETGNSRGLSYRIIKDECNWITIDDTGDLRTTSILDRDVLDMEGSQCNITVSATDHSGKTGTGKIVIKLMDENDNYPIVTRKDYIMCKDRKPICITAFDSDLPPNTAPFDFEIETPVGSTWTLTPKKDESALLSLMEDIDYGSYPMTLRIYDNGGNNGLSEITIHYCDCVIPSECSELSEEAAVGRGPLETPVDRSPFEVLTRSAFVPWGALGLGSLLMMAGMGVPFGLWLRKRNSMTREAYDNSASANLSPSNTEAPGEELMTGQRGEAGQGGRATGRPSPEAGVRPPRKELLLHRSPAPREERRVGRGEEKASLIKSAGFEGPALLPWALPHSARPAPPRPRAPGPLLAGTGGHLSERAREGKSRRKVGGRKIGGRQRRREETPPPPPPLLPRCSLRTAATFATRLRLTWSPSPAARGRGRKEKPPPPPHPWKHDPRPPAACLRLLVGLLILTFLSEACKKVTFNVPPKLEPMTLIGRVNLKQCLRTADVISSSDPDFVVLEDGSVYTKNAVSLSSEKKMFAVLLKDLQEQQQKKIHVNLLSHPKKTHKTKETVLRRSKRRWAPVPTTIMENSLGPFPMQIQQLSSDTAQKYNITYSISGPGVDEPPVNYFYIEAETGNLFVTGPIDREEYPEFRIICYAKTIDGYTPEIPLVHLIRIEDDNDNPPIFDPSTITFLIPENSRSGTVIGQMVATDRDEPDTLHTALKYRIVGQEPQLRGGNTFNINPDSGAITLAVPVLDRENVDKFVLLIEARDMAGQRFGLCNTGTAVIQVEDTNDHAPMCEHGMYEAYVSENTIGAKVMDIGIIDRDAHGTPAWHATFEIIKGNEDGAFKIERNQNSNVGTLCIEKGLDYEKNKERRLEIVVNNEAPYVLGPNARAISTSTCVVVVKVRDVDEGPVFDPCVLILNVKECLDPGTVVGQYHARDPETGNSEGIRYAIINDLCNWITMDDSGQIRVARLIDRDAPDLQLYQCNVTVTATDRSGKTGTGTVVVNLQDENDNFPVIVQTQYIMCRDRKPICLTAVDADLDPYGAPFSFSLPEGMTPHWRIIQHDEKSVYLEPVSPIDYGEYTIPVAVTDNAGHGGTTVVTVRVCDCTTPSDCSYPSRDIGVLQSPNVTLGIWAILAMILGSLLLLLILITLCGCCGSRPVSSSKHVCDDLANQNLIISNTEAPGEEVMDPNILPVKSGNIVATDQGAGMATGAVKAGGQESFEMIKGVGGHQTLESVKGGGHHTLESVKGMGHHTLETGRGYGQSMMDTYRYNYSEWQNFTHPRLTEKVYLCGQEEEHKHSDDYILSYNYEGRGSPAGSVGCCTDQQEEEALDFLDQLEPKFRTLAEACIKR